MTEPVEDWDVVVVGAGPAGENAAGRVAAGGLRTALVENELLGGECSYWACVPSKTLLRDGEVLAEARSLPGARAALTGEIDAAAVLERRDYETSGWDDAGQVRWAEGAGITVVRGHGRLAGEREVEVEDPDGSRRRLRASVAVVLATGTTAEVPQTPGLREARPWTSREGTAARTVPGRLAVLGGGPVATELATAWHRLGSRVVLISRDARLLPRHEPFAGELVAESMRGEGIDVRLSCSATQVRRAGGGPVTLTTDAGEEVEADEVLVAVGRQPATSDLGLETVGLQPGGTVAVDDSLRASAVDGGWLYAVGDVTGRSPLTHMGKYQARCCGDAILARHRGERVDPSDRWRRELATADRAAVPGVVFTDPQVCSVGRTLASAEEAGLDVRAVDVDLSAVAGAYLLADDYVGHARLVVEEPRQVVVGATFVGRHTAELLHSATVAVVGEVPLERLWHAVPSFPTVSEVWLRLLEAYGL